MKAKEYIQRNGWVKAIDHLEQMKKERWINSFFNDLKKYTDAYELIKWHGGLKYAKSYHERNSKDYPETKGLGELKQAITLVEEVGECDE